jgi:hypothetical protein
MVFPEDFYLTGFMTQSEAIEKENNLYTWLPHKSVNCKGGEEFRT